jgi:hypothetical protein
VIIFLIEKACVTEKHYSRYGKKSFDIYNVALKAA